MKTRRTLILILSFLCFTTCFGQTPSSNQRVRYYFNPGWRVFVGNPPGADHPDFGDSGWKLVSTPYAWNENAAFRVSIHEMPTGVAWYRKHFRLPESSAGKKVFLEFEGIRQAGDVYLNGTFLGRHEDGVMAFGFDISAAVKPAPAENVLVAVRTDNRWDYKEKATSTAFHWNNNNFLRQLWRHQ